MKNSISKKALSAFLAIMMIFATMAGMFTFTASADAATWASDYDVSWCQTGTEDDGNSVKIGETWYKVLGYTEAKTYEINDAQDLAGLAILCNSIYTTDRAITFFANCTFYITNDIVLTGKTWIPIAMHFDNSTTNATHAQIFGGNLIGSKNDVSGNGGVITITGMNVDVADVEGTRENAAGLIGVIGGGSVKNITLDNAVVKSKDGYATGSFVGRQWGALASKLSTVTEKDARCQTVYENLTSDARITQENTEYKDLHNAVGGIVGLISTGEYKTSIKGCTFTGVIDNGGTCSGGVVGYTESNGKVTITDCVITASSIITKSPVGNRGTGGLVGSTTEAVDMENCYVSSTIYCQDSSSALVAGAGMVGSAFNSLSFVDCHFDGIMYVEAWYFPAAFVSDTNVTGATFTLENCLNTGVVMVPNYKGYLANKGMTWFGRVRGGNATTPNTFNISNCYTLTDSKFCIEDSSNYNLYNGTSVKNLTSIVVDTNSIRGNGATTVMAGLFGADSKWATRNEMYPTLKIAEGIADTKYATADYSWFDYDAVNPANPVVIDDYDKLLALSKISKACTATYTQNNGYTFALFVENYGIQISRALEKCVTTDLFSEADVTTLGTVLSGTTTETDVKNLFIQEGLYDNSVRIGAEIKGNEWDNATFEYSIVYKDSNGVTKSSVVSSKAVTKCYSSIIADDPNTPENVETATPSNAGYYFVLLTIDNIDTSWTNVRIYFTVSVQSGDTVTYAHAEVLVDP